MLNFYLKAKEVILTETGARRKILVRGKFDLDFVLSSRSLFHLETRQVFPVVDPGKTDTVSGRIMVFEIIKHYENTGHPIFVLMFNFK